MAKRREERPGSLPCRSAGTSLENPCLRNSFVEATSEGGDNGVGRRRVDEARGKLGEAVSPANRAAIAAEHAGASWAKPRQHEAGRQCRIGTEAG